MPNVIAIQVTEQTRPLITVLNGGIDPSCLAVGAYFLCQIDGPETTSNHKIMHPVVFEKLENKPTEAFEVYTLTK